METSLRYGSASKTLRIHAKEKFPLAPQIYLQGHAEIDTGIGAPSCFALLIRHSYPQASASMCVGFQYDGKKELSYNIRGKKAFPIMSSRLLDLNFKGRCDVDKEFTERKVRLAAELTWGILNFQKGQDLRLKVGYEISDKVPYIQLRENCWTLNIDTNGKWSIRYYL
uniref:Outer envelope pore protein 21B, chloroplastic n=1 Tax=Anthurium amnicola TaxID=1678845 RepID=A0A1D1Z270_9ARAE